MGQQRKTVNALTRHNPPADDAQEVAVGDAAMDVGDEGLHKGLDLVARHEQPRLGECGAEGRGVEGVVAGVVRLEGADEPLHALTVSDWRGGCTEAPRFVSSRFIRSMAFWTMS